MRSEEDPLVKATLHRNLMVQTLGNLTIVTSPLNSSVSNGPWTAKRPELRKESLLPINHRLDEYPVWDEETIAARGAEMFDRACKIWPRPRPGEPALGSTPK